MAISVPPKGEADKKIGAHMAPLSVQAQDTPNMTVKIRAGWFYNTNGDAMEYSGGNSPTITPPGANAKWVIVAINNSGSIALVNGTAAASPVLPALPEGHMPLAFVYVPSTATSLGNDKVFDARPVLRGLDIVPNLDGELADRPTFADMNSALALKADNSGSPDYDFFLNNNDGPAGETRYMVKRGALADVGLRWNEGAMKWQFTNDGTTWVDMASVSGTFMPLQLLAVAGNVGVFNGVGEIVDSLQSLTGLATDAEVTAAIAPVSAALATKLDDFVGVNGNVVIVAGAGTALADGGIALSALATDAEVAALDALVVHKAGVETITGVKTFTAAPVFSSAGDSFINFTKGAADDAGFHVDRGVDPFALIEWDETTDQWVAGVNGLSFPILTANNLELTDLQDVDDAMVPALNDVLRFDGVEWTNDPLSDKVDVAGDTMTGALVLASGTAAAPSLSFTGELTKGMYNSGLGEISFAIAGAQKVRIDAGGITTFSGYAVGGVPGMALWATGAPTTGVSFATPGQVDITVAGVPVGTFGGAPGPTTALVQGDLGVTVQDWDADLDAVAAIAAGDGFVQRTAGVWSAAALSGAQVNTALGYTAANAATLTSHIADATLHLTANQNGMLDTLEAAANGIAVKTGAATTTTRSVVSADTTVSITNGDGVAGNIDLAVNEAAVDHDALLNFVANEHVDHSAVVLTAGVGLTGGGDITASRTFTVAAFKGTQAVTFGAIADGTVGDSTNTISVLGAVVGDPVSVGLPATVPAGFTYNAFVSAANLVTVRAANHGGGVGAGAADATINVIVMTYSEF